MCLAEKKKKNKEKNVHYSAIVINVFRVGGRAVGYSWNEKHKQSAENVNVSPGID